jgi:glutamate-1-semialdehyde 2,1-aminomutase
MQTRSVERSGTLGRRLRELVPGGAHTYAKGDDQYPEGLAPIVERGLGSHVWDVDGNEYIEYGSGLRAVALGHAEPRVLAAAVGAMRDGTNFVRPSVLELEAAETFLRVVGAGEMVKFAKNGSDVTSAAVRLARAATGRDLVAFCRDQPFFSVDDWFIGSTPMRAGIPAVVRELTLTFGYNDLLSVQRLFTEHADRLACVILEPATIDEPQLGYLEGLRDLCDRHGVVLIFDEMITGFRWDVGGGQAQFGVRPDLSCFGKALGNGFAISALSGRRDLMELGGFDHDRERVFLLSNTHGAETHALAAAVEVMRIYETEPITERLRERGERLVARLQPEIDACGLTDHVRLLGHPANLVFATLDQRGERSQAFRTLFLQELIQRGILGPSFVVSASLGNEDIDRTVEAVGAALAVYRRALDDGVERYLGGRPVKPVFRTRA